MNQTPRTFDGGRFAGSHALVELFERLVFVFRVGVGNPSRANEVSDVGIFLAVSRVAKNLEHCSERVEF